MSDLKLNTDKPSLAPGMDPEVEELCHAINSIPGLQTVDSCSGHGDDPISIFFDCNDFKGLFFLVRCIDRRYSKSPWILELSCNDVAQEGYTATSFWLRSIHPWLRNGHHVEAKGQEAYDQAAYLINNMNYHLNHKNFMSGFDLDTDKFDTCPVTPS